MAHPYLEVGLCFTGRKDQFPKRIVPWWVTTHFLSLLARSTVGLEGVRKNVEILPNRHKAGKGRVHTGETCVGVPWAM